MKPVEINITARDGWQSNHGMNVTADDFVSAYEHAGEYGVKSFQTEGGTTEDLNTKKGRDPAVYMKTVGDHFKQAGVEQTSLIRGECGSAYSRQPYDVLKATIKRQADNGVNVLQNFHAMNDINMLRGVTKASAELVEEHGYDLRVQGGITIQQNPDSLERKDEIIEEQDPENVQSLTKTTKLDEDGNIVEYDSDDSNVEQEEDVIETEEQEVLSSRTITEINNNIQ